MSAVNVIRKINGDKTHLRDDCAIDLTLHGLRRILGDSSTPMDPLLSNDLIKMKLQVNFGSMQAHAVWMGVLSAHCWGKATSLYVHCKVYICYFDLRWYGSHGASGYVFLSQRPYNSTNDFLGALWTFVLGPYVQHPHYIISWRFIQTNLNCLGVVEKEGSESRYTKLWDCIPWEKGWWHIWKTWAFLCWIYRRQGLAEFSCVALSVNLCRASYIYIDYSVVSTFPL